MRRVEPTAVRIAVALFGAAARTLPSTFRRTFGGDVREAFRDEAAEAYRAGGVRRLARATFSALADIASSRGDDASETRGVMMTGISQDLRYALRLVRRQPAFALTTALMLAVGIGGNTAVFTLVNAALLRPLPYEDAHQLVRVWGVHVPDYDRGPVNPVDAADWDRGSAAIDAIAVWRSTTQPLTGAGDPEIIPVGFTTSALFPLLRVVPAIGRGFGSEHDLPGRENEILITHGFWQRARGGDPAVLGSTVRLADVTCTIIGVLPPEFVSPGIRSDAEPQVWRPLVVDPTSRGGHFAAAVGRLRAGATITDAQAQLTAVADELARRFPSTNRGQSGQLQPLQAAIAGESRSALLMLMAAVGVVLLIACANVANLLLARADGRKREIALRGALGATRGRIVRQLVTESLLLAVVATAVGTGLGVLALRVLPSWLSEQWPAAIAATLDARVLAITIVCSLATVIVFGLMPAVLSSRFDIRGAIADSPARAGSRPRTLQSGLVVAEAALALILLVSATFLVQSLSRLQRVDPGFTSAETLTFRLSLPVARHPEPAKRVAFLDALAERIRVLPGVLEVGGVNTSPLSGRFSCDSFAVADRPAPPAGLEPCAEVRVATPGYFKAMGIPLMAGRLLSSSDTVTALPVAVIGNSMARRYWPGGDAVGKQIKWGSLTSTTPWLTIVGVVGDVKHFGLDEVAPDEVYMPLRQRAVSALTFAVRVDGSAQAFQDVVQSAVHEADASLPLSETFTTRQLVERSVALPVFRTSLLSAFAVLALVLAVTGVYTLMAFHVAQRRREIGIRLALGARTGAMQGQIIAHGMTLAALGGAVGLVAAVPLMRLTTSTLFGVTPADPLAYLIASALLGLTAFAACYVPARRVTAVSPLEIIKLP